jgi:2-iminobutanoate/2-iminopropanoate deaminase
MRTIATDSAPAAIGPYSQAVVHAGLCWCSGQIAMDPSTGALIEGDVAAQTRLALANMAAVLEAAGSSLSAVIKCTVYLADLNDFQAMNAVYSEVFGDTRPARAAVEVARLPRDAAVEIDCVGAVT